MSIRSAFGLQGGHTQEPQVVAHGLQCLAKGGLTQVLCIGRTRHPHDGQEMRRKALGPVLERQHRNAVCIRLHAEQDVQRLPFRWVLCSMKQQPGHGTKRCF